MERCQQSFARTCNDDLIVVRSSASRTLGGAYLAFSVDYSDLNIVCFHRGSLILAAVEQLDHLDLVRHGAGALLRAKH
tara:strand:- start:92 stop:325 length:234 start_codon:yes stop_codon:yes gene_type:complete